MSVGRICVREVDTAEPDETVASVAQRMHQRAVGTLVVVNNASQVVGILTDRDLALALCLHGAKPFEAIQTRMTCPVDTIRDDEGVYNATQKMMELAVRRLPVVDDIGRLVGLLSLDDLLSLLSRELRNVAEGVRAEVATP